MKLNILLATIAIISVIALIIIVSPVGKAQESMNMQSSNQTIPARQVIFADLGYKIVRPGQFIHFYDSSPHSIADGHIAVHINCDEDGVAPLSIAIGVAPNMTIIPLNMKNMIHELSTHGDICLYHLDLPPKDPKTGKTITATDIALINNGKSVVRLKPESSVVINVHAWGPAVEEHEHEYEGKEGGM